VTWRGQPLSFWTGLYERRDSKSPLTASARYTVCRLALQMGMSEAQFYDRFDELERAQLVATYQTQNEIEWVQHEYPLERPGKRGKG
jgi:hypothetical protein